MVRFDESEAAKIGHIWADGGYAGDKLRGWMQQRFGARPLRMEIVRRSDAQKGFAVLPRHRVLERTFAWLQGRAQGVEDGGVETLRGHGIALRGGRGFVRFAIDGAPADAAAGHDRGEARGPVLASGRALR